MRKFKITLVRSNYSFEYDNSVPLLFAIEQQQFQPEFGCRSGFCGACACKVISGQWHYASTPIALCREQEILLCCCIVDSDLELDL